MSDPGASWSNTEELDLLELELRQLGGVVLVSFSEGEGALRIELLSESAADRQRLQAAAERVASRYVAAPVSVLVVAGSDSDRRDSRVQLVLTAPRLGRSEVEVHLSFGERRVTVVAPTDDRVAGAAAVVTALRELVPALPFEPVIAHALPTELGAGTLVVLENPTTKEVRRGVAGGASAAESTARAVLNALNRYLESPSDG